LRYIHRQCCGDNLGGISKVLFIDDEPNVVSAPQRQVRQKVDVQKSFCDGPAAGLGRNGDAARAGARMLRVVSDLDDLLSRGFSHAKALEEMHGRSAGYDPRVLAALEQPGIGEPQPDFPSARMADISAIVHQNAFW
jgi:hypothetical protein